MIEDLKFADNICLLAHKYKDVQVKLTQLHEELQKVGLSINISKTAIESASKQQCPVKVKGKVVPVLFF
jgi:hypothetical protein